jgi:hypothetical protein
MKRIFVATVALAILAVFAQAVIMIEVAEQCLQIIACQ